MGFGHCPSRFGWKAVSGAQSSEGAAGLAGCGKQRCPIKERRLVAKVLSSAGGSREKEEGSGAERVGRHAGV